MPTWRNFSFFTKKNEQDPVYLPISIPVTLAQANVEKSIIQKQIEIEDIMSEIVGLYFEIEKNRKLLNEILEYRKTLPPQDDGPNSPSLLLEAEQLSQQNIERAHNLIGKYNELVRNKEEQINLLEVFNEQKKIERNLIKQGYIPLQDLAESLSETYTESSELNDLTPISLAF